MSAEVDGQVEVMEDSDVKLHVSDADAEVKVVVCVVCVVAEEDFEVAVVMDSSDLQVVVVVEKMPTLNVYSPQGLHSTAV